MVIKSTGRGLGGISRTKKKKDRVDSGSKAENQEYVEYPFAMHGITPEERGRIKTPRIWEVGRKIEKKLVGLGEKIEEYGEKTGTKRDIGRAKGVVEPSTRFMSYVEGGAVKTAGVLASTPFYTAGGVEVVRKKATPERLKTATKMTGKAVVSTIKETGRYARKHPAKFIGESIGASLIPVAGVGAGEVRAGLTAGLKGAKRTAKPIVSGGKRVYKKYKIKKLGKKVRIEPLEPVKVEPIKPLKPVKIEPIKIEPIKPVKVEPIRIEPIKQPKDLTQKLRKKWAEREKALARLEEKGKKEKKVRTKTGQALLLKQKTRQKQKVKTKQKQRVEVRLKQTQKARQKQKLKVKQKQKAKAKTILKTKQKVKTKTKLKVKTKLKKKKKKKTKLVPQPIPRKKKRVSEGDIFDMLLGSERRGARKKYRIVNPIRSPAEASKFLDELIGGGR